MLRQLCLHPYRALAAMFLLLAFTPTTGAQEGTPPPPSCSTPEYRQFDFWLGEWDVINLLQKVEGKTPPKAINRITSILDGCAVLEDYASGPRYKGTSLNLYDAEKKQWRQLWIDSQGKPLELIGGREGESMVLRSPDGNQRLTWTPLDGGKVQQLWEVSEDGGKSWKAVFDGLYTPR